MSVANSSKAGQQEYDFTSVWRISAPVRQCWDFLTLPDQTWTAWWPSLRHIDVQRADRPKEPKASGILDEQDTIVGTTAACTWRSPVGHQLRFVLTLTDVEPSRRIVLSSEGDLDGTAVVNFAPNGTGSELTVTWKIRTTRRWMNVTAPVLRPVFRWGHHVVMRRGERGLNRVLTDGDGSNAV